MILWQAVSKTMTLEELANETLVQKHLRLTRERCRHPTDALFSSTFMSRDLSFTEEICLDCGMLRRTNHLGGGAGRE